MKPAVRIVAALIVIGGLIAVSLYTSARRNAARSVLSGYFESQPTSVASRVQGRVLTLLVTEGQPVRTGQLLMTLDAGPQRDDVLSKLALADQAHHAYLDLQAGPRPEDIAQARARVAQAQAQYNKALAGPRPQEVAQAAAAAHTARAKLAEAVNGPTAEERAQARAVLDSAAAQETLARADYARYSRLYTQDAVTRQQLDQSKAALQTATANRRNAQEAWQRAVEGTRPEEIAQARGSYRQAQAALDLVRAGTRPEDVETSAAQLREAQAALDALLAGNRPQQIAQAKSAWQAAAATARNQEATYDERNVRSPIDGVVDSVPVSTGDLVSAGTALARIDDPADIWIRVFVPEAHLAQVKTGDSADLRIDGIPGTVDAYVESIASSGEFTPADLETPGDRGQQVFGVRLRLRQPDPRVKAGIAATVTQIGSYRP